MKSKRISFILILALTSIVMVSVATAEVPDTYTSTWADFKFKNQELFRIQSPDMPGLVGSQNMIGDGRFLLAQNQATETDDASSNSEQPSAFSSADEAARQSSNPLGGQFMILLNQFDNYAMQGDITDKTRWINTWAIQWFYRYPWKKQSAKTGSG